MIWDIRHVNPRHGAVFVRFAAQGRGGIGFKQISHIQVQMAGDVAPVLFVPVHGQNLQRKDLRREQAQRPHAAFLCHLFSRHGPQIPVPVGVAAQPRPGVVEIMVGHQHPAAVGADHPGRRGQVRGSVIPGHNVHPAAQPAEEQLTIALLLLVVWAKSLELRQQTFFLLHHNTITSVPAAIRMVPIRDLTLNFSCRKIKDSASVITTLSLSMGTTLDTSPSCSAR